MSRKRKRGKKRIPADRNEPDPKPADQGEIDFEPDEADDPDPRDAPADREERASPEPDRTNADPATGGPANRAAAAYRKAAEDAREARHFAEGVPEDPEELSRALLEARAERDEYLDLARRTQAELENYRKRVRREMADMKRESLSGFLRGFFGALDDLDRALLEGEKKHDYKVFHEGVKLVRENLWRTLEAAGVRPIPAEGKKFDPNLHEAMTAVPSSEHPPGTVIEVFQPGYRLDDFVLRPAKVIVSAAAE